MEKENKISFWAGNFKSEDELNDFMQEQFTDDGDMYSEFMTAFKIDFIDNQFQEVFYSENLSKNDLKSLSYSESFLDQLPENFQKYNGIIAIYNFEYAGEVSSANGVDFIGVYDYEI